MPITDEVPCGQDMFSGMPFLFFCRRTVVKQGIPRFYIVCAAQSPSFPSDKLLQPSSLTSKCRRTTIKSIFSPKTPPSVHIAAPPDGSSNSRRFHFIPSPTPLS